MNWYFVEIHFDGVWTPVGRGETSYDEAAWRLAMWRAANHCHLDSAFRIRKHTLAAPPPADLADEVEEVVYIGALPPSSEG